MLNLKNGDMAQGNRKGEDPETRARLGCVQAARRRSERYEVSEWCAVVMRFQRRQRNRIQKSLVSGPLAHCGFDSEGAT